MHKKCSVLFQGRDWSRSQEVKNSTEMNYIENDWNIMKKEIGNRMSCSIEEMCKRVCEAWYSVELTVQEELYNSMPRRIADLIEANGDATKY